MRDAGGVMRLPFRIRHLPEDALRSAEDTQRMTQCALQKTRDGVQSAECAMHLTADVESALGAKCII